jgi:hypothetical protein
LIAVEEKQRIHHYFAYGSNLHPVRLTERVPSAKFVAAVELTHHDLAFHKKSHDGSGKCNLLHTGAESDMVHGAIYQLDPEHKAILDRHEGKGSGYVDKPLNVRHQGRDFSCFTYLAQPTHIVDHLQPYHWYKKLVLLGARYLQFPHSYIAAIESVKSIDDPDESRTKEHDDLIRKILHFCDSPILG